MKTTKTVEPIYIEGNVLIIDKDKPKMEGEIYIDRKDNSIIQLDRDMQNGDYHLIIASKVRISPSIPLIREESLIVKERYEVYIQKRKDDSDYETEDILIADNLNPNNAMIIAEFYHDNLKAAQQYCNFLNRQHEQVDVEKLAEEKIRSKYPFYDHREYKEHGNLQEKIDHYKEGIILGYNSAPKGGYSEEDIKSAINFGINAQAGIIKIDYKKYNNLSDKFFESLKPKPTTITIYEVDGSPLTETIDGVEYIVTQ